MEKEIISPAIWIYNELIPHNLKTSHISNQNSQRVVLYKRSHPIFLHHFTDTQCFYVTLQPPNVFMAPCNHLRFLCNFASTQCFFVTMQLPNVFTSPWNHGMFLCNFATIYGTLNKLNALFFHHFTTTRCFYAALQRLNKCMNASVNPSRYFLWDHKVMWNFWPAVRNGTFWQTCKNTKKCWFKQ